MSQTKHSQLNLYIDIFERFPHSVILLELTSTNIVFANQAACKLYGYSFAEFITLKNKDIHALPEYKLAKNFEQVISGEKTIFQSKHKDKNHQTLTVDVLAAPIEIDGKKYLISVIIEASKTDRERLMQTDVFFYSPDPMALLDKTGKIFAVNQSFVAMFGYTAEDLQGEDYNTFVGDNPVLLDPHIHFQAFQRGKITNIDTVRKSKSGRVVDVNIIVIPFVSGDEPIGAQIVYREITELVENKKQLHLFKEILQNNTDGVMITDSNQKIEWVNDAFTKITEYTIDEVIGEMPSILHSKFQEEGFYENLWKSIRNTNQWQGEIWNKRKGGTIYIQWLHIFAITNENNEVVNYVGFLKDLSDMSSVNKKILMMLEKDPLTSVYNRAYFFDHLSQFLEHDMKEGYVVFIDLDGFKEVNDDYGHQVGDEILIEFSKRMLLVFREDTIARYGGDEFIILLKNKDKKAVIKCLEQFINLNHKPYNVDIGNIRVFPSIGISQYPNDSKNIDDLIDFADKAMYHAKHNFLDFTFYQDLETKKTNDA